MPAKQAGYEWLWDEGAPAMLVEMLKLYGTREVLGAKNNPTIMGWANETHTSYPGDAVAWCGLTISVAAMRAGWDYHPNGNALWARNWADWGKAASKGIAMLGDVLVFPRGQGGHVTMYVGEDAACYHCLGGNQSDGVNIVRKAKTPILAIRRAPWKTAQPTNVRRVILSANGAPLSTNEA